ncbi:hypothetical protein BAR24_11150 [Gluconobacter oxydans]|nr:hypothetical protein BAR24_11150 [Gluconobacter oxydans]
MLRGIAFAIFWGAHEEVLLLRRVIVWRLNLGNCVERKFEACGQDGERGKAHEQVIKLMYRYMQYAISYNFCKRLFLG